MRESKHWQLGAMLLVCLAALPSCRKDPPPSIVICIGDGVGGADCDIPGEGHRYFPPSQLKNFWMTTQRDMAAFSAWCYQTDFNTAMEAVQKKEFELKEE